MTPSVPVYKKEGKTSFRESQTSIQEFLAQILEFDFGNSIGSVYSFLFYAFSQSLL